MWNIIFWMYIFLNLLKLIIFVDIILSWLTIFWIKIRPQILADIIDPMYFYVRKYIKTSFWPLDFTPIIVIIAISLLEQLLFYI